MNRYPALLLSLTRRRALSSLATALALMLSGPGPAAAQNKLTLGVAIPSATHSYTAALVYWANKAKKDLEAAHPGLQIIVKTASGAPEQANQLQDLTSVSKIDTLVVLPFESAALTKPVAQVKAKGVYVLVLDRGLTDDSQQDAYLSSDNVAFGKVPAEYIAKTLGGKGNVVALRGIPTTIDTERMTAFNAVLKNHPDIKLLDHKYANWNPDDAFKVMQDFLTRFSHIDAVWAADDDMALGVLKAIDQAKRKEIKLVFGGAGSKGMIKTLMDNSNPLIQANVSYSPKSMYDAIKLTVETRLKGEKLPARTILPSLLITRENAKDFYFPDSPY